jgi:outer membrane protein OmpA-like peptidoglycan-associated protein
LVDQFENVKHPKHMRPLITGIIIFLVWLIIASWYYSSCTWPALQPVEETAVAEEVSDTTALPAETPAPPDVPDDVTLYFDYNKTAILNPGALNAFIPAAKEFLAAETAACLQLTGHACDIGTEAYNLDLGKRRAAAVNDYLLKNGFTTECIKTGSKGESEPALPNTNETNRKKNRRVELHIKR